MKNTYENELFNLTLIPWESEEVDRFVASGHPNFWVPDFDTEDCIGPTEYGEGFHNFISSLRGYEIWFGNGTDVMLESYDSDTNIYKFSITGYDPEYNDEDQDIIGCELTCIVEGHIVKDDTGLVYLLATSLDFDESQFDVMPKN